MKRKMLPVLGGILVISGILMPSVCFSQNQKTVKQFLTALPSGKPDNDDILRKYRMSAVYTNLDLYGNFSSKTLVSGEYTEGSKNNTVSWNNVFIAASNEKTAPFGEGKKQDYMENITYVPSSKMLDAETFKNFPANFENVLARNLIWDMMSIEMFAWDYSDSLQLNKKYVIPKIGGEFDMAEIGTYEHAGIQLCWTGISFMNNEMCAVIEYRAIDNKLKITMDEINTKGTEQYWGTTWISLKSKQIEYAEMYGGTIQEIEVRGMENKLLFKTIRELWVEKI
ncbi:MAG: hypothetical protein E4H43_04580 [Bacteroidia bacterium]|nr:MAG: hypothetical protein E4H43_04580 [Bacteroidia bacterium]